MRMRMCVCVCVCVCVSVCVCVCMEERVGEKERVWRRRRVLRGWKQEKTQSTINSRQRWGKTENKTTTTVEVEKYK